MAKNDLRKRSEQHVLNGGWRTLWVRTRSDQQYPVQQRPRTQRGGGEAWRGAPALSPHQADKPGNEKSEAAEASRGREECVCGQEEVSGCLDGCIGGGAAGKSEEPQCTCITTTWPPLPPHSFHNHHFVCDVRTKVKRKYWMMFVHYSIIFKRCIPQKTSLRILNHHGLFFLLCFVHFKIMRESPQVLKTRKNL